MYFLNLKHYGSQSPQISDIPNSQDSEPQFQNLCPVYSAETHVHGMKLVACLSPKKLPVKIPNLSRLPNFKSINRIQSVFTKDVNSQNKT